MRIVSYLFVIITILTMGCKSKKLDNEQHVVIKTEFGDITIRLYNETPLHRDNLVKLANEGFYDGLLMHRVIENFMIQGGDPKSKNAAPGISLGDGSPGYTLPAEFVFPTYFHKRGAVAAARQGDRFNPERASSGSQFYIVQGSIIDSAQLHSIAVKRNDRVRSEIWEEVALKYRDSLNFLHYSGLHVQLKELQDSIMSEVDRRFFEKGIFSFTPEQIKTYTTIGGTPFLDGEYTVFGEVIEGMNVVDSIASVDTDPRNRPVKDVIIKVKALK